MEPRVVSVSRFFRVVCYKVGLGDGDFLSGREMRVKAILFDLDGTIFDVGERDAFARYRALRDLGFDVSLNDVRTRYRYGLGSMGVVEALGITLSERQEKECIEASFGHFMDRTNALRLTRLQAGAYDALSALSKIYRLGLVTSRNTLMSTEEELGWFNIREFFMLIVTREVAAKYFGVKDLPLLPFEEQRTKLYECATKLAKLDPRRTVCVGDAVEEIEPARKLGIRVIGVLTGFSSKEDMEEASILTIGSLGELVKILDQDKD